MQRSGRTAWTITLRSRWITLRFAKDTGCGMALRTWMMGAWRRWLGSNFDGWNQATATEGKYKGGDHIPGMNVGGWYDAGDFDLEEPAQLSVIQSLALAYREFHLTYDEITVDEAAREVEMHRPDGVPDTVQQVKHGAVPPSLGTWGGSGAVVDMAIRMYFLHKAFPELVSPEYTLRAVNYILGTHPVSSTSYVAGVGTVSKTKTYSNNRADNSYIPGAVIPGYIIIKPDFPECIDDFGFLWFEDEAVVAGSASWVVAGNAAEAIIEEAK
jgi:hypothetical protein